MLESSSGWQNQCVICRSVPTRWKVSLPVPDFRGRHVASFCERHEANKDMLLAGLQQTAEA